MQPDANRPSVGSLPQKSILVVDDDPSMLCHLEAGLSAYPGLQVVSAENGVKALTRISDTPVDLVITDIQMPEMDGLSLVSYLSQQCPGLPIIVVTAHGSPDTEEALKRLGIVSYLKKPILLDLLAERVFDVLAGVAGGYLSGISVASFLQLLHSERKTCCLRITCGDRVGMLHFVNGDIWDAEVDDLTGLDAALEIVPWEEDLSIDIQNLVRLKERTIDMDVTFLVMEAFRRKDEAGSSMPRDNIESPPSMIPERGSIHPEIFEEKDCICINPGKCVELKLSSKQQFVLFECLMKLRDVQGYKAAALLSYSGDILASHSVVADADVELTARGIHGMFRHLVEDGRALGLASWEESVFRTASGAVLFRCTAREDVPHVHLFAVTQDFPAEALLRMRMKRVLDEVTRVLSDTPAAG